MKITILELIKQDGKNAFAVCKIVDNGKVYKRTLAINELFILKSRFNPDCTNFILKINGVVSHKHKTEEFRVSDVRTAGSPCNNAVKKKGSYVSLELDSLRNSKTYDGRTSKFGITYRGSDYIVKFAKEKNDASCFCEDVASRFIRNLGYQAHETMLIHAKDYDSTCVLLKDFTSQSVKLRSFKDTEQSSEDTDIATKAYTYKDVVYMIKMHRKIPETLKPIVIERFWLMYMLDAILANRDRHHGNWGYLCSESGYSLAPIYDNGSSLFPNVTQNLSEFAKNEKKFLFDRAERFPASLLMVWSSKENRAKRTNYYEYIGRCTKDKHALNAYESLKKKGTKNIADAIKKASSSPLIQDELRRFFVDIVIMRYAHIILRLDLEDSYKEVLKYGC